MFKQFDTVKIIEIKKELEPEKDHFGYAPPKVGDVATIVEIYKTPSIGYELESVDENGQTKWLMTFSQGEVELLQTK